MTEGPLLPTPPLHRIPPPSPRPNIRHVWWWLCLPCRTSHCLISCGDPSWRNRSLVAFLVEDSSKTFDPQDFKWPGVSVPCCCSGVNTAVQCCSAAVINQCQSGVATTQLLHNSIAQVTAGECTLHRVNTLYVK